MHKLFVALLLALLLCCAPSLALHNPFLTLANNRYLARTFNDPLVTYVTHVPPPRSSPAALAALPLLLWRWAASPSPRPRALSFRSAPDLPKRLLPQLEALGLPASLAKGAPLPTLLLAASSPSPPPRYPPATVDASAARSRTRSWVARALVGLNTCPFTASADSAAAGLEFAGIAAAPILYAESGARDVPGLAGDFWEAAGRMLERGQEGCAGVVLSAPAFDGDWETWHAKVFPVLEESLLAAGLGRELGIVCFHPSYETPGLEFLRRHRFGHMHHASKLLRWVDAAPDARELREALAKAGGKGGAEAGAKWAGGYQRRSPHAMINVLWAGQLEAAEGVRESEGLYVRNLRRLLREGRGKLDEDARKEREVTE